MYIHYLENSDPVGYLKEMKICYKALKKDKIWLSLLISYYEFYIKFIDHIIFIVKEIDEVYIAYNDYIIFKSNIPIPKAENFTSKKWWQFWRRKYTKEWRLHVKDYKNIVKNKKKNSRR